MKINDSDSCYLFGDGPSLKYFCLKEFAAYPAMLSGQLYMHKNFSYLNTQSIINIEPWYFCPRIFQSQYLLDHREIMLYQKKFIKENQNINFFLNLTNYFSIHGKNVTFLHRLLISDDWFFNRISSMLDPFGGSFTAQIILAYLLGYKKVYLIGFDSWVLNKSSSNRWYEFGLGDIYPNRDYAEKFLKEMSEELDMVVISVNKNEHPVLRTETYESHTDKKPSYKENFDLLSSNALELLNSDPKHKIYN